MTEIEVEMPDKLVELLFEPARYKVAYGGRGSAKSWSFAKAALIKGLESPQKILCAREIQKSIQESVHALLKVQIDKLGLRDFYEVTKTSITGKNGTEFIFAGLKHNVDSIKSIEGLTIVWIEEAHNVSKSSWDKLIPTVRYEGSEIWITFNPELEEDETYQRFVINPPDNAKVVKVNWSDNPWFPLVLAHEKEALKRKDPDAYQHVWEGNCKHALEGAIYANELREAKANNRISNVPHDSSHPVQCYFDLGHADSTVIWFVQSIGHEFRFIDYYENQFQKVQHYVDVMNQRNYAYDRIVLPHDAEYKTLSADRTTAQIVRNSFVNATVDVLPKYGVTDGIDAARTLFNQCYFDESRCSDGLQALRHYRYDVDPDTGRTSQKPLHDWSSHCADAFRYFAVSATNYKNSGANRDARRRNYGGNTSYMAF